MSNPKFGFRDCAVIQRRVREADARGVDISDVAIRMVTTLHQRRLADNERGPSVDEAYEVALREVAASWNPGREPGTRVNDRNEVVPIRAPRPETKPTKRIVPVSVETTVEDVIDEAEIEELNPSAPVPVAGEDGDFDADFDPDAEEIYVSDEEREEKAVAEDMCE